VIDLCLINENKDNLFLIGQYNDGHIFMLNGNFSERDLRFREKQKIHKKILYMRYLTQQN